MAGRRVIAGVLALAFIAGLAACEAKDIGQLFYNSAKSYCETHAGGTCDTRQ